MNSLYILPTGNDIKNGTVLDLDSPEIMKQMLRYDPEATIVRLPPILDDEEAILQVIERVLAEKPSLIVLIGGSGGGHRFSKTLGKDFTHSALEQYLNIYYSHEIYGKNGHMWTKLICGKIKDTTIINVPGPFVEAQAAFGAYLQACEEGRSLEEINHAMAQAVYQQYPSGTVQPR